jgi:hypothetical protein
VNQDKNRRAGGGPRRVGRKPERTEKRETKRRKERAPRERKQQRQEDLKKQERKETTRNDRGKRSRVRDFIMMEKSPEGCTTVHWIRSLP